jgi:hypothetical protein
MSLKAAKTSPGIVPVPKKNRRTRRNKPKANKNLVAAENRAKYFNLSPCSKLYLSALTDPFDLEGGKACIPDLTDFPSFKTLVVARGSFAAGTQKFGFVGCNPLTLANDDGGILSTTAGYTLASFPNVLPDAGVNQTDFANLPFTGAQFDPNGESMTGRTVGCGLRIRYTGTELNRSGRCIPYRTNSTYVACNGLTVSDVLNRAEVPSIAVKREWINVTYLPTQNKDYEYAIDTSGIDVSTLAGLDLAIMVDGCEVGATFEYEIYLHKEFIAQSGKKSLQGQTPSHSDVTGISAIRNVLETNMPIRQPKEAKAIATKQIESYAPEDTSGFTFSGMLETGASLMESAGPLLSMLL